MYYFRMLVQHPNKQSGVIYLFIPIYNCYFSLFLFMFLNACHTCQITEQVFFISESKLCYLTQCQEYFELLDYYVFKSQFYVSDFQLMKLTIQPQFPERSSHQRSPQGPLWQVKAQPLRVYNFVNGRSLRGRYEPSLPLVSIVSIIHRKLEF